MCENVTWTWNRATLRVLGTAAIVGTVVLGSTGGATAGNWKKHGRYYYAPAPVYVAPAPVYYARPVYYAPPPPVVVYPAPVAYGPPAYYGPSYYGPPGGSMSLGINVPLR
jgi:hypothetical protein